jgi:hypothetical protein
LSLSDVEDSPLEHSIFLQMNKTMSAVVPVMESVTDQMHAQVYEPLQFLEVDTMKLFRHVLQDVQHRSVDCLKSQTKCVKYLKRHSSMVREWVTFRQTRHEMLLEKLLSVSQHMASEVSRLHSFFF